MCVLGGCGDESLTVPSGSSPSAVVGAAVTEPQSNQEDYLLQEYDVKEVGSVPIEELEMYDVSGPSYSGISEIISDEEAQESTESTQSQVTVYVAPMYNAEPIKTYECTSAKAQELVEGLLNEKGIHGDITSLLRKMYQQKYGSIPSTAWTPGLNDVANRATQAGWIAQAGITGVDGQYRTHLTIANAVKAQLTAEGYNVVMATTGVGEATSNAEKAREAKDYGAVCAIMIGTRKQGSESECYCKIPTSETAGASIKQESFEFATVLVNKLTNHSATTSIFVNTGRGTNGVLEQGDHAVLGWASVPTVWVQCGNYVNEHDRGVLASSDVTTAFAQAITDAIVEKYPVR